MKEKHWKHTHVYQNEKNEEKKLMETTAIYCTILKNEMNEFIFFILTLKSTKLFL